jgi:hypothetical protein
MNPDAAVAVTAAAIVIAAAVVYVAADQFLVPFVHMIAVRWFDLPHAISTVAMMTMTTVDLIIEWSASVVHRWTGAIARLPWSLSLYELFIMVLGFE